MTLAGHVKNGVIVLDEPMALAEGLAVEVHLGTLEAQRSPSERVTMATKRMDRYRHLIGALDGQPEDWSENHDKYLRELHDK